MIPMIPTPTPDQAMHVLHILGEWTKRGFRYEVAARGPDISMVEFTGPENPDTWDMIRVEGVNHFDAICQATTVMQVLLEEHPKKTQ